MKISACIITHNEERNLPRCLKSVAPLVDEILIVDSGSTDATPEIAAQFGARLVHQDWLGYVGQKNFALDQATHPWVLSIDADEEMKRIRGIIDSMTLEERSTPSLIDISRRRRIAAGSGVEPADVSGLVKQFDAMAAFVKQMSQMSMLDKIRAMTGLGKAGAFNPGARLVAPKQGTGKRLTPKEKEKLRKEREKEERKKRREMKEQRDKDGPQPGPPGK